MEKTMTLQKRAIAFLSAVVLAISMTCVVPFAAYAVEGSGFEGSISATDATATVAIGDTIDMSEYFELEDVNSYDLAHHIDYAITSTDNDTGAATINKHSGILTPSATGTVTVTAYLLDCAQPSGVQGAPCYAENKIDTATKTVTITGNTGSYGFQGNDLQIQMMSFSPQVVSSSSTAYVNTLSDVSATDGYYCFVINQSFGTGSNFETFLANNTDNITLTRGQNANSVASLGDGVLTLDGSVQSNTVTVKIPETALTSGNYTLTFAPDYQAGNGRTLDATISFTFSI